MLKKILLATGLVLAVVVGLFMYYVYSPKPSLPPLSGELVDRRLTHDGLERSYSVYLPKVLSAKAPVVFVLHGSRGNGKMIRDMTVAEFDQLADRYGMVVVYPDGFDSHWNDCRRSADYEANQQNIDDVGFIAAMIDQLETDHKIDRKRVFVTGFSNGGHMVYRLALEVPEMFAGFSPIVANLPVDENLSCNKKGKAVSIAIFIGTDDPINPYEGGLVTILGNDSRGEVLSAEQTVAYWRGIAGLSKAGSEIQHSESDGDEHTRVIETRWGQGKAHEVRLYTLHGSGHVIPSTTAAFPRILGRQAGDVSAPEEIVTFFLGSSSP